MSIISNSCHLKKSDTGYELVVFTLFWETEIKMVKTASKNGREKCFGKIYLWKSVMKYFILKR